MSDLTKWKVHGPVRSLRIEHAEWDVTREEWQAPRFYGIHRFRRDGKTEESESHNPDGAVHRSTYLYDDAGRLLEIRSGPDGGPVHRTLCRYDDSGRHIQTVAVAPDGTTREIETVSYDRAGRKIKVFFVPPQQPGVTCGYDIGAFDAETNSVDETIVQDMEHRVLSRFLFSRDGQGRLLTTTQWAGEVFMQGIEKAIERETPEKREQAMAALASVFGSGQAISTTTYSYDEAGRLTERRLSMGPVDLGGDRTKYQYDDGLQIGEISEQYSRRYRIDESGNMQIASEESHKQHVRFEYVHDTRGNWTQRVAWRRLEPNPNFERSVIERREITYY